MTIQNLDYYRYRADEELAAAQNAADPATARIHREMARRYREMLGSEADIPGGEPTLTEPMGGAIAQSGPIPA